MSAAAIATPLPAAAPSAPIAIDHAAAWQQPSARPAWQIAVIEDPDLSAGAQKQAWRLALHCLNVPRWRMTVAQLGKECRQSRSVAFTAFNDLERYGYARRNGEFLEIIPIGFRTQSGNPDSPSPEIRTPEATVDIVQPRANVTPRAQVSREQEQKLIQEKKRTKTAAPAASVPPNPPTALPIAKPNVVLHAEELRKELIARQVAPREAAKLVKAIPFEVLRQAIAAGDAYVSRAAHIDNRGGIYAAAVRKRWQLNKKDRHLYKQAPERPITRPGDALYQSTHCELCSGFGMRVVYHAVTGRQVVACDHKY